MGNSKHDNQSTFFVDIFCDITSINCTVILIGISIESMGFPGMSE